MHMSRQAARQAAALAKQAATLAEAAGGAPGSSSIAETLAASSSSFLKSLARSQTAGLVSAGRGCHTAAAAARQQQQPVWQQAQQRGLRAWAVQQGTSQHLVAAAASAASHSSAAAAAPWHCQQQRSFSAQAEPAPSSSSNSFSTDGLTLSDAAVERLKELQAQGASPVTLRVTVEGGGCSGFQYEFAVEEPGAPLGDTDRVFERDGVRLVSDDISLDFLKGATVDYESDLMRSAFVVAANPNAASSCGCGSSFVAK